MTDIRKEIEELFQEEASRGYHGSYVEDYDEWENSFDDLDSDYWEDHYDPEHWGVSVDSDDYEEEYNELEEYYDPDFEDQDYNRYEITDYDDNSVEEKGVVIMKQASERQEKIVEWLQKSSLVKDNNEESQSGFVVQKGQLVRLQGGEVLDILSWLNHEGIIEGLFVSDYLVSQKNVAGESANHALVFERITIVDAPFNLDESYEKEANEASTDNGWIPELEEDDEVPL